MRLIKNNSKIKGGILHLVNKETGLLVPVKRKGREWIPLHSHHLHSSNSEAVEARQDKAEMMRKKKAMEELQKSFSRF